MAVLIPSIDLMGGKIVQLVRGEKKALEFTNFDEWIARFSKHSIVQLIDLDAAIGNGDNRSLVQQFAAALPTQVGGGIRTIKSAREALAARAKKIIIGSSLFTGGINLDFARELHDEFGLQKLIFAVDARNGRVAIKGWKEKVALTPKEAIRALDPFCSAFLYTHIDTEGLMQGIPMDVIRELRDSTQRKLIAAGGIRSMDEVNQLDAIGVDAVVGMAIYTGAMQA
jgi:phosphoribosylformimino-5-aminoimidazole carboxamide ribotide isomerase